MDFARLENSLDAQYEHKRSIDRSIDRSINRRHVYIHT